jgi:hypothetical protein
VALAVARLPLSAYAVPSFSDDSPFLYSVSYVQGKLGVTSGSLLVALLATIAAAGAVAVAFRGHGLEALAVTIALAIVSSAGAIAYDLSTTSSVRPTLPHNLTWVDDSSQGQVTVVATPYSQARELFDPLYWNGSIIREVLLGNAFASDVFSISKARVTRTGDLLGTRGDLLFDIQGTSASLADAKILGRATNFVLWHPNAVPRLRLLIEGRYPDHWLSARGRIRVWPLRASDGTQVSFRLETPAGGKKAVHLTVGRSHFVVRPSRPQRVICRSAGGPIDLHFSSRDAHSDTSFRLLSLRLVDPAVTDIRKPDRHARTECSVQ